MKNPRYKSVTCMFITLVILSVGGGLKVSAIEKSDVTQPNDANDMIIPNEYSITFGNATPNGFEKFLSAHDIRLIENHSYNHTEKKWTMFRVNTSLSLDELRINITKVAYSAIVEHVVRAETTATPNDFYYEDHSVSGVYPFLSTQVKYMNNIEARFAWDQTASGTVVVAVIDSGVNYNHEDLASVMWNGNPKHGTDTIGVGDNDPMEESPDQHGTPISGIIAASFNNALGIAGVAKSNIQIMAIRSLRESGGNDVDIAEGINWAVDQGAKVISMSFCISLNTTPMNNAIDHAWRLHSAILVGSAGNKGSCGSQGLEVRYPATDGRVIAVSALKDNNQIWDDSARGSKIELSAPGQYILMTTREGGYGTLSGTSMAAPMVSAAAAWAWAVNPAWARDTIRYHLKTWATKVLGQGDHSDETGYGVVNTYLTAKGSQNDAGTGGDVGSSCSNAISSGAYTGYLSGSDTWDSYKFWVSSGQMISVWMTPAVGVDFDLGLQNQNGNSKGSSAKMRSLTDNIEYTADSTGYWCLKVQRYSDTGIYQFSVRVLDNEPTLKTSFVGPQSDGKVSISNFKIWGPNLLTVGSWIYIQVTMTMVESGFSSLFPKRFPTFGYYYVMEDPNNHIFRNRGTLDTIHMATNDVITLYYTKQLTSAGYWCFWPGYFDAPLRGESYTTLCVQTI